MLLINILVGRLMDQGTKVCYKCKVEKSLDGFHNSKRHADGKRPCCKACKKHQDEFPKRTREQYSQEIAENIKNQSKICGCCGILKSFDDYGYSKYTVYKKQHKCRECVTDYCKEYTEENKAHIKERMRLHEQKNKERLNLYRESRKEHKRNIDIEYRKINADKISTRRETNKEKYKITRQEYKKRNKSKILADNAKRVAQKLQAIPKWANLLTIRAIYDKCSKLSSETGIKHHVDHLVPLRNKLVCGLHCEDNLRVVVATENLRKSNVFWPDMP